ncbi:MAG: hypothetical protein ABSB42_14390 [Tepidisphaeraceae bacterium]|jgi:predicted nuclease with TOPRIM domain
MGKLAERPAAHRKSAKTDRLTHLQNQRRKLSARMAQLDRELSKLSPTEKRAPSVEVLDRWLDELSDAVEDLPSLPADFARADLYNDHD